jgi:galactitol-specific phosphotransferase system IIC component
LEEEYRMASMDPGLPFLEAGKTILPLAPIMLPSVAVAMIVFLLDGVRLVGVLITGFVELPLPLAEEDTMMPGVITPPSLAVQRILRKATGLLSVEAGGIGLAVTLQPLAAG